MAHIFREIDRLARQRNQGNKIHFMGKGNIRETHEPPYFFSDVVELFHPQRQRHPLVTAESVHQDGHLVAPDVLKEQRYIIRAFELRHAIRDLRNLKLRLDLRPDAPQPAARLQRGDELPQIFIGQWDFPLIFA